MLPNLVKPMLATAAPQPFDSDHHLFEIKWDGIGCLAFVENGQVRLQSRELIDITAQFPELAGVAQLPDGTVLDGELVAMEENRPSLAKVQSRALLQDRHRIEFMSQSSPVVYVMFDLVYVRGESIMAKPLLERRQELEQLLSGLQPKRILLSQAVLGQGRDLFQAVQKLGLEGIVAKSLDGHYRPGKRTALWKKIKINGYHRPATRHPPTVWP
jgi:ATP-dependent DNA ligase